MQCFKRPGAIFCSKFTPLLAVLHASYTEVRDTSQISAPLLKRLPQAVNVFFSPNGVYVALLSPCRSVVSVYALHSDYSCRISFAPLQVETVCFSGDFILVIDDSHMDCSIHSLVDGSLFATLPRACLAAQGPESVAVVYGSDQTHVCIVVDGFVVADHVLEAGADISTIQHGLGGYLVHNEHHARLDWCVSNTHTVTSAGTAAAVGGPALASPCSSCAACAGGAAQLLLRSMPSLQPVASLVHTPALPPGTCVLAEQNNDTFAQLRADTLPADPLPYPHVAPLAWGTGGGLASCASRLPKVVWVWKTHEIPDLQAVLVLNKQPDDVIWLDNTLIVALAGGQRLGVVSPGAGMARVFKLPALRTEPAGRKTVLGSSGLHLIVHSQFGLILLPKSTFTDLS